VTDAAFEPEAASKLWYTI